MHQQTYSPFNILTGLTIALQADCMSGLDKEWPDS